MSARHSRARRDEPGPGSVVVTAEPDTTVAVVAVEGPWSIPLRRDAYLALRKCLSAHPEAVVVDLTKLHDPQAVSVATWLTARQVGDAMEPAVRVVVCLPPKASLTNRLTRMGAVRYLPLFDDVGVARAALVPRQPLTSRVRLRLPADPDTPALARNLVTEACAAWKMPDVLHRGRLVMSELAGNAVQHARSPIEAFVSRRGSGLHIAVGDRDPRFPMLIELPEDPPVRLWEARGQGLRTVRAAATAWGSMSTADGKVVWATVRPSPRRPG